MLKKIDQSEIEKLDDSQRQNLMVNADGEYVFAQADEKAWKRHLEQVKAAEAAQKNVKVGNQVLQDKGLECPIDKRLFVDPMKTPCCGRTYCHDCIENALLENDLTCPGCETENISLERLEPDEEMKNKIKEYETDQQAGQSHSPSAASPKAEQSEGGSRPLSRDGRSKSPDSVDTTGQSRKRTSEEANTEESSDSLAPPAMKRQKSGEDASTTQASEEKSSTPVDTGSSMPNTMPSDMSNMMPNMPMNFPMMPFMMPNMMPNMMGMNGMNGMAGMTGMNGMGMPNMNFMPPNFNMMNGMFPNMNDNLNPMGNNWNNGFGGQGHGNNHNVHNNQHQNHGYNRPHKNFGNKFQNQQHQPPSQPQPTGMSGVPTGPKSMQTASYPPTGPAGNKFSNQQRHTGNEEDNAYMRQPVNPHRAYNRGRGKMRQADYREL